MSPHRQSQACMAAALALLFSGAATLEAHAQDANAVAGGADIFHDKGNCQACHGWAADGMKMDNQMPDGSNLRETKLDRAAIIETIKCGRPGFGMPAFDKFAYTDDRCYGTTEASLKKTGVHLDRGSPPLLPREIDQVVDFLFAKVIGKGPMNREKCIAFWGEDTDICKTFK